MSIDPNRSPLSGVKGSVVRDSFVDKWRVETPLEGVYEASDSFLRSVGSLAEEQKARLCVAVRQAWERGEVLMLRVGDEMTVGASVTEPTDDSLRRSLLELLEKRSKALGDTVHLDFDRDYPAVGAFKSSSLVEAARAAHADRLITIASGKDVAYHTNTGYPMLVVLTREGREYLRDERDRREAPISTTANAHQSTASGMIKVFISHSHTDAKLAAAVYDLLVASLGLTAADLRATSVKGAKIAAGTEHAPAIRQEVREATVCVGLITPNSMASDWAIFEMGARWGLDGTEKLFVPMRAKGVSVDVLRGPLRHLQANSLGESADVHQMIHQIATRLGVAPKPPQDYSRQLDAVVRTKAGKPPQEKPAPRVKSAFMGTEVTVGKDA